MVIFKVIGKPLRKSMLLPGETLQNKFDEALNADFPLLVSGGIGFVSGGKKETGDLDFDPRTELKGAVSMQSGRHSS